NLAGEKAAAERTVGNKTDSKLATNAQHLIFRIAGPKRILRLERCDRMHRVRATNCFGAGFGQSEKAYLAFANQLRHRTDSFFNWRVGIDPVLIIKIDYIDIEPAQTSFARFLQVIRLA